MQIYMHLTGITRAHVRRGLQGHRRVCTSSGCAPIREARQRLLAKAAPDHRGQAPAGAGFRDDPAWWECRFCDHHAVCHDGAAAELTCRSCLHATPVEGGWHCARLDRRSIAPATARGCPKHLFIPDLVPGEVIDAGDDLSSTGWPMARAGSTTPGRPRHDPRACAPISGRHRRRSTTTSPTNRGHPLVVIPTAGGKSIVLAAFIQGALAAMAGPAHPHRHPRARADRARTTPRCSASGREAPAGIYSAGLSKREIGRADPVRRHPVDPPARLRRPALRSGADRRGASDPAHLRHHVPPLPRDLAHDQSAPQGHRLHGHALSARQRHAARGRRARCSPTSPTRSRSAT